MRHPGVSQNRSTGLQEMNSKKKFMVMFGPSLVMLRFFKNNGVSGLDTKFSAIARQNNTFCEPGRQ